MSMTNVANIAFSLQSDHFVEDRREGQEGEGRNVKRGQHSSQTDGPRTRAEGMQCIPAIPLRRMPAKEEVAECGFVQPWMKQRGFA